MSRPIRWCLLAQKLCLKRTGTPRLILRQDEKSGLPLLFCKRLYRIYFAVTETTVVILHVRHTARRVPEPGELS